MVLDFFQGPKSWSQVDSQRSWPKKKGNKTCKRSEDRECWITVYSEILGCLRLLVFWCCRSASRSVTQLVAWTEKWMCVVSVPSPASQVLRAVLPRARSQLAPSSKSSSTTPSPPPPLSVTSWEAPLSPSSPATEQTSTPSFKSGWSETDRGVW